MWLFTLFRDFTSHKKPRNFYRFWYIFYYSILHIGFIGSDTYFTMGFPESTTHLVTVNRRLRPVSCVSWLPLNKGKNLKGKKKPTNQTNKNSRGKTTPAGIWKVARSSLHTNVQISLLARDTKAWLKGQNLLFYIGQKQPETPSKEKEMWQRLR